MGNVGRPLGRVKVYFQLHSGQKWEPSHFSLISQARKVELRHFKSLRSLLDMGNVGKPWRRIQVYFQLHTRQKYGPTVKF